MAVIPFRIGFFYRIAILISFFCCVRQIAESQSPWSTPDVSGNIYNTNTGNVGIGTANPSAKLEITNGGNPTLNVGVTGNRANTCMQILNAAAAIGNDNTTITSVIAAAWDYYNNGSNPSWSSTAIQHFGTAITGNQYGVAASNLGALVFTNLSNGVIASNGANIYISPSGNVSASFLTNGNVGINTMAPRQKMDVWGGDFVVTGTDLTGTAYVTSRGGTAYYSNNTYSNGIAILPSGNVLIGQSTQSNSSYIFDVAGNVRANRLVVNTTGADFVFDPGCHISPLSEVDAYIQRNHHLPGIKSAAEMQKDGLDVGEEQTKLLQKIEELTLYIIEQNKELKEQNEKLEAQDLQLKEQNKEIGTQEARINRLEKLMGQKND